MRLGTPGFVAERLVEARAARRIPSKTAFARLLGVHPSTVSRWEEGAIAPDSETLTAIADLLQVRREYFLRPINKSSRPLFFRSLSNVLARDSGYQETQIGWLQELSHIIGHYVDFPQCDIPDVLRGASYKQLRDEDIEEIALDLRRRWGLGEGPCIDMVPLLERVGCIVGAIEIGTSRLDGVCSWSPVDDRPHILLANDKMSFPRRQMDAAHELGHAVLHREVSFEDLRRDLTEIIEPQAFRFASAFLMPSTSYPHEVRSPSLAGLLGLKERWRVSVKAQIKRLVDLAIIPSDHATYLYKLYSAKGWAREEPLDRQWPLSEPKILADSLNLIVDAGIRTKTDLLSVEFVLKAGEVENLTALPHGWFARERAEVVQLKSERKRQIAEGEGVVLPFLRKT